MIEEIQKKAETQFRDLIKLLEDDLKGVKTGRAKPSLIEDLQVEAYQSKMALKELASISAPDPHSLIISPWDKTILESIAKGIAKAGINLNPIIDNELIRIQIPSLSEETRKDLVKLVNQKLESCRKMLRQIRNELKREIEGLKGEANISEDDLKIWLDELQKMIDETLDKIEDLGEVKEKELMTI
ncbi:ribosome recycling factor [Candidatus Beckwithbacteria bacterium CG10_big_fil_rev_8_21_14_0_10_34_10]|uniref:Ribosome-recycling factor n=1 Tax=Candidatus Beckwithbacteria bacterium CG10_big_fil_rev_8_21_14_0_10_34_10 TaxID=1974495 RepID=A0A2H0W9J0_9BACT|nr:MAG: ribosome recycling factor [Candidatus Beckwithbacteria bacterium CG10_big_fil_rev_8_21_14_0_10_34_10]